MKPKAGPETDLQDLADAVHACLVSPNEMDSNCENANVVDGLFAIARALRAVAKAIEKHGVP